MKNQRNEQPTLQRALRVAGMVFALATFASTSGAIEKSAADIQLEKKVMEKISTQSLNLGTEGEAVSKPGPKPTLRDLRAFQSTAAGKIEKCVDVTRKEFGKKYVLSLDASGEPCRIYDLSFPTLKTMFAGKKALQVPVQNLTSKEYLDWMDGKQELVEASQDRFKASFNPKVVARGSWIAKLKFKNRPEAVEGSKYRESDIGLPKSFRLSDLDFGRKFVVDAQTRMDAEALEIDSPFNETLAQPESLLHAVRFQWNDLEKVYDVILDGEFLPLSGPVALVDYKIQYKYAVEKLFRSILGGVFGRLARVIPVPMVSGLAEVVIHDVFEQIELAYEYQLLQLEDTLRMGTQGLLPVEIDVATSTRALNLVFGQRADLIPAYIMAVATGQPFDWTAFDKIGKTARYNEEKQRDIMMSKMNSKLVLDKGCKIDYIQDTFAECTRNGKKDAIYSLTSEQIVFRKHFGAPLIYRYDRPSEVALRRGGTWLLSVGLRVFGLPIARSITYNLNDILKNYIQTGLLDEAFLRNGIYQAQAAGVTLSSEDTQLLKWLYIQNLNPFLPKSEASEANTINVNRQLLAKK